MTIRLYHNKSERIKIGKTLDAVNISSTNVITGTLRAGCSVTDPEITLTGVPDTFFRNSPDYVYIDEFARYYFVNGITCVQEGVATLSLHVDVLESFKTDILNTTAVVARQEEQYNVYLNDSMYKVYSNPYIIVKKFPNTAGIGGSFSWVLSMAGGG